MSLLPSGPKQTRSHLSVTTLEDRITPSAAPPYDPYQPPPPPPAPIGIVNPYPHPVR